MRETTGVDLTAYECRTCDARFFVPERETAICCPVCRMNRVERDDGG